MTSLHITKKRLLVLGRVQGVGYRESMRLAALRSGCTGWVRNLPDGSVEALVQGPPESVAALIAWAGRGPPAARVDSVQVTEAQGDYARFEVLRTG
ncbi:MAG: acylphosphatase [Proteobacteria bacterium]|nr:acylphosphatase [Pseudomonadota bacterium]